MPALSSKMPAKCGQNSSKTFTTYFFPVGPNAEEIVTGWVHHLQRDLLSGPDDPLFPATQISVGPERHFTAVGLARKHWPSAAPIRDVFKAAFSAARLPYFNPHSFRKTLVALGEKVCTTWEEMQSWAQNLGHESMTTTFGSYGQLSSRNQGEVILALRSKPVNGSPLGRGFG